VNASAAAWHATRCGIPAEGVVDDVHARRVGLRPGRPRYRGGDTHVDVVIPLRDLLAMDGASLVEDTWLRARAGEHGYLTGKDAEAIACDALIVPVVTGAPDWAVIGQMITLIADARPHGPATGDPSDRPQPLPPEGWEALQYALAKLAIRFVSGPGALASTLRRTLLGAPLNTKSVPLDIGHRGGSARPCHHCIDPDQNDPAGPH
jgi:hypothetical protein